MFDYDETDSDDDLDCIMRRAVDVTLPDDFDPNSVPQTGEEYLHHVIYERSKCKKWVTSDIDTSKFAQNQTFRVQLDKPIPTPPETILPSEDWQNKQLQQFKEFREYILPQIDTEPTESDLCPDDFMETVQSRHPTFSEITPFTQHKKLKLLQKITKYLHSLPPSQEFNANVGTWAHSILTLLEIPLSPDACHTLREFAKACASYRAKLPADVPESGYIPLNLFICIVSKFFNQLDLADR